MPNYNIISPLAVTSDNRAQNNALGLGSGPVNPFAAAVEGGESGLTFGANLSAKIQQTNRDNDPDVLAAEKLRNDLNNKVLQRNIDVAAINDPIQAKYADRAALADITEKESRAEYWKNKPKADSQAAQELQDARVEKLRAETSSLREKSSASRNKTRDLTPAERQQMMDGIVPTFDDGAEYTGGDGSYNGSFPTISKTPDAPQLPPVDKTDPQSTSTIMQKYGETKQQAFRGKVHELTQDATGLGVSMQHGPDGAPQLSVKNLDKYVEPDGTVRRPLDAATGLGTLSQLNDLYKQANNEEDAKTIAGAAGAVFSTVPMDELNKHISQADEKQRPYLVAQRDSAAAMIAANGNSQYLSQDQKAIQAAGLPFSALKDPEGTTKKALSLVSDGATSTDDIDLKNSLDGNQYFAAFTAASKNGKEPVTIRQIPAPPASTDGADTMNPKAPPPTVTEFRGATGAPILVPTPVIDEQNPDPSEVKRKGQLRYVESLAPKLKDVVSVGQETDKHMETIQNSTNQGGQRGRSDSTAASTRVLQQSVDENAQPEKEFYNSELKIKLAPHKDEMPDVLRQEYLAKSRLNPGNSAEVQKAAAADAQKSMDRYERLTVAPLQKDITEAQKDSSKIRPVIRQMDRIVQQAADEGYTDLFGREGQANREALRKKAGVKSWTDYITGSKSLTEDESKQLELLRDMESLQQNMILPEMEGKSTAFNTSAEQIRGMKAKFNEDTPFSSLQRMTAEVKNDYAARNNVHKLGGILLDRGYRLGGKTNIESIARDYLESGAAEEYVWESKLGQPAVAVKNPNYRTPEDYLFNPRTGKPTAAGEEAIDTPDVGKASGFDDNDADNGGTPPAVQKKNLIDRLMPDWVTPTNFQRGVAKVYGAEKAFEADPAGTTKNAIIGSDESRAASKESLVTQRMASDPEFRTQVDTLKKEMKESRVTGSAGFFNMVVNSMSNPTMEKVNKSLEDDYDGVVNRAQELVGIDPEVINQRQISRDAQRTANKEMVEDDQIESPWTNAAASAVGFTVLNSAVGKTAKGVGFLASKPLAALAAKSPTVQLGIEGIEKLAKSPFATNVLNTAKTTATETAAYAIPGDEPFKDKILTGAIGSLAGHKVVGPVVSKAFGAVKEVARRTLPIAQNSAEDALGNAAFQRGVPARDLEGTNLENASEAVKAVTRDITDDPAARRVMPTEKEFDARYAAEREGAMGKAGLDSSVPSPDDATSAARTAVEGEVQSETARQTAAQEAEFTQAAKDMEISRQFDAADESLGLRGKAAQTREELVAMRKKNGANFMFATKRMADSLVNNANAKATKAIEEFVKFTGIDTEIEHISGASKPGSPTQMVRNRIKDLNTSARNLENTHKIAIDPENPDVKKSIYRVMEEKFPELDSDAVTSLEVELRDANESITNDAIRRVGKVLNPENPDEILNSFEYLDNLHRELGHSANVAYGGNAKYAGPKAQQLQAMVRATLDEQVAASMPEEISGHIKNSETPYTELNTRYGAVREAEKGVQFYRNILEDLRSNLEMKTEKNVNYEEKYLGGSKLQEAESQIGVDGVKSLRKEIAAMTESKKGLKKSVAEGIEKKAAGYEQRAADVEAEAARPTKQKPSQPKITIELSPELKEAAQLTTSNKQLGRELLDAGDTARIKNVSKVLSGDKRSVLEDSVRSAVKDTFAEGKTLSAEQWKNAAEVFSPEEIAAFKSVEQKFAGIENKKSALSNKASATKTEAATGTEIPHSTGKFKFQIMTMVSDLFRQPQYRSLTKFEKAAVAKALSSEDPVVIEKLFTGAARRVEDIDNYKAPPVSEVLTALGFGQINKPESEDARRRQKEAKKNSPEGRRNAAAAQSLRDMD